jgi:hypothetical protein
MVTEITKAAVDVKAMKAYPHFALSISGLSLTKHCTAVCSQVQALHLTDDDWLDDARGLDLIRMGICSDGYRITAHPTTQRCQ